MADEQQWITQQALIAELENLLQNRQTGTLFCATEQGNSATITVQQGAIKGLGFRTTFGAAALPLFAEVSNCRLNFRENVILRTDADLPDTNQILAALGGQPASPAPVAAATTATATTEQNTASVQNAMADSGVRLDIDLERLKKVTAQEATELLGPVGTLLAEEYFAKVTHFSDYNEVRTLITALVGETGATERTGQLIHRIFTKSGIDPRTPRN